MEAMVEGPGKPELGLEKKGDLEIYRDLLGETGLHHKGPNGYDLRLTKYDPCKLGGVWEEIDSFLEGTEDKRKNAEELFDTLSGTPCSVSREIAPVLFAAYFLENTLEVALYLDGCYEPEPGAAFFSMLSHRPSLIEMRRFSVTGARLEVCKRIAGASGVTLKGRSSIVPAVGPLYRSLEQLPGYSRSGKGYYGYSMVTRTVSPRCIALRNALMRARDPHELLFSELPEALGLSPVETNSTKDDIDLLFVRLKETLDELADSYQKLLDRVKDEIALWMGAPNVSPGMRVVIREKYSKLLDAGQTAAARNLIGILIDDIDDDDTWAERITCIVYKHPRCWDDGGFAEFQVEMMKATKRFDELEEMTRKRRRLDNKVRA